MTLKAMRDQAGLTQEALAAKSTIPQSTVSALEIGRIANPGIDTVGKLADAYDVPLVDIINALRETLIETAAHS